MSYQILDHSNRAQLAAILCKEIWVIACICAQWCERCREYMLAFAAWAKRYPEHHFVWIDIEDQADLVDDLDIVDFPNLLIQRGTTLHFFGPVKPNIQLTQRLLQEQMDNSKLKNPVEPKLWHRANLKNRLLQGSINEL